MAPVWDQTALRHEKWKSRITILNDLECPIIVWTQSYTFVRVLRIGNGPERSAKHSQQLGAYRNIRETQPILCSRITIVTMSWQILLYRIKTVTMSCVVWTVSCGTGMIWSENPPSHDSFIGRDYHVKRFSNGCLPSASVHCLVTVWSLSDRIRENRDAVGTDSVIFYHAKDTNRIRIGLRTG